MFLGPTSFNEQVIWRLDDLVLSCFALNISRTKTQDLLDII